MSLMHLLSVGRTFGEVREKPASYRVVDGVLPEFAAGGEEPHIMAGRGRRVDTAAPPAPPKPNPKPIVVGGDEPAMATEKAGAPIGAGNSKAPSSFDSPRNAVRARQPADLGFHSGLTNGWGGSKNRRRQPRRGTDVNPAQRELSLNGVQVVRNDLSDADLELVRSESARSGAASGLPLFSGRLPTPKSPTVLRRLLRWLNPRAAGA